MTGAPHADPAYALAQDALLASCDETVVGGHGAGGQHRNRHQVGVRLLHRPTGVEALAVDHRERIANQRLALQRLRLRLACRIRGQSDPAWLAARRRGRRLPVTPAAKGYHLVVAVLLDALAAEAGTLAAAAAACGVSTSQAAKVLTGHKEVRAAADEVCADHGRPPLR